MSQPLESGEGAEVMWKDAFLAADNEISAEEGCTATALLAWQDASGAVCMQAANAGDSSAYFIDADADICQELTEDHRLSNASERQRLTDMGIQVSSSVDSGLPGLCDLCNPYLKELFFFKLMSMPSAIRYLASFSSVPSLQLTNDSRRLYGLNLSRGLGDKFLKDEDLGDLEIIQLLINLKFSFSNI
jgi:hypothetical protein